ncbi:phage tail tape measure protein [Pseudomonas kermanshahensis]|uniref:phage tail tape measure protein n=1 Tax=Pseudomonas kermanshahensis TaxID=2745482 RepID=UPI0023DC0CBB|nr:phage tail tape measure protein [Pseudomonas kermanshahensis]WEL53786.1 phage tail tape measure protein [Pseudomonas kermanshahensis]
MANNKFSIGLVIGGVVSATVGAAFKDVEGRIGKLKKRGEDAKVLQGVIGETMRLRDEWKKASETGEASARGLRNQLDRNLDALRKQGVEVGRLEDHYRTLGRTAQTAARQAKGLQQIEAGKAGFRSTVVQATVGTAALAVPTKVSADYQAIVRDIAIKAGVANKAEEVELNRGIISTAKDTGLARNGVAEVLNQLVGAGMDLQEAARYSSVAAKFVVGQGADGTDTARMINALGQNAKITDPVVMQRALEAIAYQGQAGSFEASDMAKWFPELLAGMAKQGIYGMDAVTQLGSMLQVQIKSAGSADEAANNLKNWMEKIGSSETVKAYKDAGIDYQKSLNTGLQNGMSTLESSFALAQQYIQKTDPKKAAAMAEAAAKINQETDPEKAKRMMQALEESMRTGDLFADMQVKSALMAYMQNKALYEDLKTQSADAAGILDQNLAERRETSSQKWKETANAIDDAFRAIGDGLRPLTDGAADVLRTTANGIGWIAEKVPSLALGATALAAGGFAITKAVAAIRVARGLYNVAKGAAGAAGVQRVFVTNPQAGGGKGSGPIESGVGDTARRNPRRSRWGRVGGLVGRAGRLASLGKGVPVLGAAVAALQISNAVASDQPPEQKAEGVGSAVGGLAGGIAGAATGAALGSIIPVVGTAIGGLVGGILGSLGGDALGAKVGSLFASKVQPDPAAAPAEQGEPAEGREGNGQVEPVSSDSPVKRNGPESLRVVPAPAAPAVSYEPKEPDSTDPFLIPALTAGKVRFPGAPLTPPPAEPVVTRNYPESLRVEPAPTKPVVSYDPKAPESKDSFRVPAPTVDQVRYPGVPLARPPTGDSAALLGNLQPAGAMGPGLTQVGQMLGDYQRAADKPVPAKAEPASLKLDQRFELNMPVTVKGDVSDRQALAYELRPYFMQMIQDATRDLNARQLYDAPHL